MTPERRKELMDNGIAPISSPKANLGDVVVICTSEKNNTWQLRTVKRVEYYIDSWVYWLDGYEGRRFEDNEIYTSFTISLAP